jgi:tryptophanyl-tRNA synthetase
MRILSGIQPSGSLHIGNYFGMMKPMIEYQQKGELFCFIANLHALTTVTDGKLLKKYTLDAALDFLALGIDPEKSTFWVQSDIPAINELTWYLSNVTPLGLLQRSHSYKDKVAKGIAANAGLFNYPILMAADILAVQTNVVPVGKDQKQHVEIARDIAIKFNNLYGEIFTLPEPQIAREVAIVPGTDGQKMSKSYGNFIEIFGEENVIRKKIMSIVTDSTPVEKPKDPEKCNVFNLYRLFATPEQEKIIRAKYENGNYGYGEAKKELFSLFWEYFRLARERRQALVSDPVMVQNILKNGAAKAAEVIERTLAIVRSVVGTK